MTQNQRWTDSFDCLIVGAGHAGAQTAITLRQLGFAGSVGLFGDEPVHPYERPALSKEYLAGKKEFEHLALRPSDFWPEQRVDLRFGARVTRTRVLADSQRAGPKA